MTDFLQNLGTIGCLGAEREAFATQLSATHTTRKSHVFAGTGFRSHQESEFERLFLDQFFTLRTMVEFLFFCVGPLLR